MLPEGKLGEELGENKLEEEEDEMDVAWGAAEGVEGGVECLRGVWAEDEGEKMKTRRWTAIRRQ
ncbi:hypothetical protein H0H87_005885, partial [Tephrocybe sp. NHM501043]